ncbi:MAG: flagellar biosynthetic protein FliR [Opitutales bacterium]|tara:strand:- start:332 stop:1096 length:765 start_codon:yes stop_codon:yes gene_type:complete
MTIEAGEIVVWVLVFLRTGAFFLGIPLFAGKLIPVKVRTAFGLLFSILINPLVPANLELANHFAGAILLSLNEICIGLLLAMTVRMIFFAVELAGHLISYEIGLMASNSVNPLLGSTDSTITTLLYYFSMLIFFVAGIHYDILKAFILSFEILPIGSYFLSASPMVEYAREVSNVFVIGTLIAAPFIALNFMINISFAVLGKAVPKMNVFMTSFSIRILSGLVLLVSSILLITSYILDGSKRSVTIMLDIIQNG